MEKQLKTETTQGHEIFQRQSTSENNLLRSRVDRTESETDNGE